MAMLAILLEACASTSPGRSTTQVLHVETPGCARASCTLGNDFGKWQVDPTPGDVTVTTSEKPLEVACRAHDEQAGGIRPPNPLRPVSPGSGLGGGAVGAGAMGAAASPLLATPFAPLAGIFVVAGGVTGAGVGRAADANSRTWSYPAIVSVPFRCDATGIDAAALATAPFGLAVRSATPAEARDAGVAGADAALVTALAPTGRAAAAGLHVGDAIIAVDGQSIDGALGLQTRIQAASKALTLTIMRGGQALLVVLALAGDTP